MAHVISQFQVEDFVKWKTGFDSDDGIALRKGGGMKSYSLFHVDGNPNKLVMLTEFDTVDTAREFIRSEALKQASKLSGVIGEHRSTFLSEIEKKDV